MRGGPKTSIHGDPTLDTCRIVGRVLGTNSYCVGQILIGLWARDLGFGQNVGCSGVHSWVRRHLEPKKQASMEIRDSGSTVSELVHGLVQGGQLEGEVR